MGTEAEEYLQKYAKKTLRCDTRETPCIAVLLENDMAMLTYFNNDGESYVSVGDEKRDDGIVAFSAGQYEVWNYQIIKKDEALAGLMDFFQCKELPQSIKWERVC
ncbi:MAG: hypothetical protein J6P36_02035 [Lachnospiraceae bacterium]|nr:hypothetical protein [Lachnospiraceae bacterium]